MERCRWQSASRIGKAPLKKRRLSPLPEAAGHRAGVSQPCRRRLFESRPAPGSLKRKVSGKTLPKIKENIEVTQLSHSCDQSNQVNVKEKTDVEKKEEKIEDSTVHQKESLMINTESRESVKNAELTSSMGTTLPTGVSTFLLQCLDVESTADFNTGGSSSPSSYSSPETFRDEDSERINFYPEDSGKYKNSTLLDSSKAVAIDKIPQISNLSAILEPVLADFQDQYTKRERPSDFNFTSSALSVSTTLAGKKVCKITAARERTPDLRSSMCCSSPLGPERKPDNQTAKSKRLMPKKKGKKSNTLEEGPSSFRQPEGPGNALALSAELTAEVLPSEQPDAVGAVIAAWFDFDRAGAQVVTSVQSLTGRGPISEYHSLCVTGDKPAPSSELRRAGGPPGSAKFRLPLRSSGLPKECLKITLQIPKIGPAVNTDEIPGFQQESTEEELSCYCGREVKQNC